MDHRKVYDQYLKQVEEFLSEYLPSGAPENLYKPFQYVMTGGGKRIRPVLTMLCAGAVGGSPGDSVKIAAAIEILHNFTLVHDDIMDKSLLRRNRETVHVKWDEASAILTGDVMIGYVYKLLPECVKHENAAEIINTITNGLIEVCEGQTYDMDLENDKNPTMERYLLMIEKKTARLLETAAVAGAYFGKGSPRQIDALRSYANNLGIAFQIQDDLLDMTAEQIKLGKKVGQDAIDGKKTFLLLTAMERAESLADKALIDDYLCGGGLPEERVSELKAAFKRLDVFERAQSEVEKYFSLARAKLDNFDKNECAETLYWLTESLNKRKY